MKKLLVAVCCLMLTGCARRGQEPKLRPEEAFKSAQGLTVAHKYHAAIAQLEHIDINYPLSPYVAQARLNLIYLYYQQKEYALATAMIDRVLAGSAADAHFDYLLYMAGLINMEQSAEGVQRLLGMDVALRQQESLEDAFAAFKLLLVKFPGSQYAADASARLKFLVHAFGRHELSVCKFYYAKGGFVAVINRGTDVLTTLPHCASTLEVLKLMQLSYLKLHLPLSAALCKQLIAHNGGSAA